MSYDSLFRTLIYMGSIVRMLNNTHNEYPTTNLEVFLEYVKVDCNR